jgi:hypothetical protein
MKLLPVILALFLLWDFEATQQGESIRDTVEFQVPGDAIWQDLPGPYPVQDGCYKVDLAPLRSVYPTLIFRVRREWGPSNAVI